VAREIASGDLAAHLIIDPTISRRLFVIYSGSYLERIRTRLGQFAAPKTIRTAQRGLTSLICASRQGLVERLDRLMDDRCACAIASRSPFFRGDSSLYGKARKPGGRRDAAHERGIVPAPLGRSISRDRDRRPLAQSGAQIRIAGNRRPSDKVVNERASPRRRGVRRAFAIDGSMKRAVNTGFVVRDQ